MILGAHRETLFVGVEAGAARHGPAFEDTVRFKAEVPVEAGGVMLLDYEAVAVAGRERTRRLRRLREIPLGVIAGERIGLRHVSSPARV
jgi:hypothetical protein